MSGSPSDDLTWRDVITLLGMFVLTACRVYEPYIPACREGAAGGVTVWLALEVDDDGGEP